MKAFSNYLLLPICLSIFSIGHIKAQGIIVIIAGTGISQYIGDGYPATNFSFALPKGICVDKKGKVYVADYANCRIRTVSNDTLYTIADTLSLGGDSGNGGLADTATLRNPDGVCLDTAGNIYITEWYNGLIRKIGAHTGIINTICGIAGGGYGGDGGPATLAKLSNPGAACTDIAGNIYIPDYSNHRIRKITIATDTINTIAGTGVNGYSGDSGLAINATLSYPSSICVDISGNVYFSEHGNNVIRRIDAATGIITTIAGNGTLGYSGDGHLATNAQLGDPNCVFVDRNNYIYISDYANNVIRAITPAGIIYTIAGSGGYGYSGNGGPPLDATFRGPTAVCTDDSGYVYIADGNNSVIWKMTPVDTVHLGVKEITKPSFSVYPNPSTGKFSVIPSKQTNADIRVTNTIGQCLYTSLCKGSRIDIDISGYPPGIYYVQYITPGQSTTQKIVIH